MATSGVRNLYSIIRQAAKSCKESFDEIATQIAVEHERRVALIRAHRQECPWHSWSGRKNGSERHRYNGRFARRHGRRCFSTMRICRDQTISLMRASSSTFWQHNTRHMVRSSTNPYKGWLRGCYKQPHVAPPAPQVARAGFAALARDSQSDYRRGPPSTDNKNSKGIYFGQLQRPLHRYSLNTSGGSAVRVMHQVWRHQQQRTLITGSTNWLSRWKNNLPVSLNLPQRVTVSWVGTNENSNNNDDMSLDPALRGETLPLEDTPSSYVDFDVSPQFSIPSVTELTEDAVEAISTDMEAFAEELKRTAADIRRVANLGELPVSIERNNGILRVHFPNSDSYRVESLLADVEVSRGVVMDNVDATSTSSLSDGRLGSTSSSSATSYNSDVFGMNSSEEYFSLSEEDIPTPSLTRGGSSSYGLSGHSPDPSVDLHERLN